MMQLKNKANPLGLHYSGMNELRSHADMMALWSCAIALAEAEEAAGGPRTEQEVIAAFFAGIGTEEAESD